MFTMEYLYDDGYCVVDEYDMVVHVCDAREDAERLCEELNERKEMTERVMASVDVVDITNRYPY